jgi:hypothetical protein
VPAAPVRSVSATTPRVRARVVPVEIAQDVIVRV